ncbi:MAG TPA: pitrilysin family protein [Acidobacteriota bacterium]|nr:pitrilysin family protein [Acidobacteriota bacterium]
MIKTPPPPGPIRNVSFPEVPKDSLDNGLRVLTVKNRGIPKIWLRLAISSGGKVDAPFERLALAPLTLEMVEHGTRSRSAQQLAREQDRWAIHYKADARLEYSLLQMDFLKSAVEPALDQLSEMLMAPAFDEGEIERVRARWHSLLSAQRSMPRYLADDQMHNALFPDHPYCKKCLRPEHLKGLGSHELTRFHARHYGPSRATLLLAGDIDQEEGLELARRYFGQWKAEPVASPDFPDLGEPSQGRVSLIHRPHSTQTRLLIGGRTFARNHPHTRVLRMVSQVLGGGASARLFLNLREAKGYTYGIYSEMNGFKRDGLLTMGADIRSDALIESIEEIFAECRRMAREPVGQEELQRARAEVIGAFIAQLEAPATIAMLELLRDFYGLPEDHFERYIPEVQGVSAEEIQEAAARYLDPARYHIVVVADRRQVEEDLKRFGPVTVYDKSGNQIES